MASKKLRQKNPLDMFSTHKRMHVVKARKDQERRKTTKELRRKELREKACIYIARWFFDAGIAFHGVKPDSFAIMCEFISQHGPQFKPPFMYELRVPFLKKEVDEKRKEVAEHES